MPSAPGLSGRARGADKVGPTRLRIHETEVSSSIVENMAMDVCGAVFRIEGSSRENFGDRIYFRVESGLKPQGAGYELYI